MKALITGITGQDGSYLAEFLLERGYDVHGTVRRVSGRVREHMGLVDGVILHSATLESYASLDDVLAEVRPDEIYHLAAQSFVGGSFGDPFSTMQINIAGTHYLLAAAHRHCKDARIYFAGSSEQFGNQPGPQDEATPFAPCSPYAISKMAGYHLAHYYREVHGMFVACGILFNHESPRRGPEFVTRKITQAVAEIVAGRQDRVSLGNMSACRDWGHARDYVIAMWRMLQQDEPDDFVVATGTSFSVEEFASAAFSCVGLDYRSHCAVSADQERPADVQLLRGNPEKARRVLGWTHETEFYDLVSEMVEADCKDLCVSA